MHRPDVALGRNLDDRGAHRVGRQVAQNAAQGRQAALVRDQYVLGGVGRRALGALEQCAVSRPNAYAFVVGESGLATQGRRTLHKAGLPKNRITFSGFWKA